MNRYGTLFTITIYGESHQPSIGVIIDGITPGLFIDVAKIKADLALRRPQNAYETKRIETDDFIIKSGVFNGYATGAPLCIEIKNNITDSKAYEQFREMPRPGTADYVGTIKYHGYNDYRGGGHFSGRLTALLVIAGSIAKMMIPFQISHRIKQIGLETDESKFAALLQRIKEKDDSIGGIIELTASSMIVGLGSPFFGKLTSAIGAMLFAVPAVKGVDFGVGFAGVSLLGSTYNDLIIDDKMTTKTNHSGGINGGISNGNDIIVNCFIKPISSIGITQETYNFVTKRVEKLLISGNHDASILRRVGIVLESALAIVLADYYLLDKSYAK